MAPKAIDPRFERPVHSAIVRSTRWPARYFTPSTMSVRIRVFGPVRSGRKFPTSRRSTPAASRAAAVEPVSERAGGEGEEQPREAADEGDGREGGRIAGDPEGHERQGDEEDAVGEVGEPRGRDETSEHE